jgi:SAM-dependent methyltransferase
MIKSKALYACPGSGEELNFSDTGFSTADGRRRFPTVDGVPNFLAYPSIEDGEQVQTLIRLNEEARTKGWEPSLRAVYGRSSSIYQYVTDEQRAAFLDLLPLNEQAVVLEIGTGLGQITTPLARRCRLVYGLEVVPGQARFTWERCRQSGLTNVLIATGGDDCQLPYASGAFDVVICNLVLEWCAARGQKFRAELGQRQFLSDMFRVLKRGGSLWLNTKNRFSLRNLFNDSKGCTDHGKRTGRLRKVVLSLAGKNRNDGLTHSYNKLTAMLQHAGFRDLQSFWATPEMRCPAAFIPTDPKSVRAARRTGSLVQGDTRSTRLLMPFVPALWVKQVMPGLTFLAKKI